MSNSSNQVEYYRNKTLLLTGATGFVGKAILWHLLKVAGTVLDKVYVLIRPKRVVAGSPSQRLLDEIINTAAFRTLEKHLGTDYKKILKEKLIPIACDLSLSNMDLSMEDSSKMRDTNIVIHCAASSEYGNSLDWNIETNVLGTVRLMDYIQGSCPKIVGFIHLSVGHLYQEIPNGTQSTNMMEYVYDLGLGEPEDFLNELLDADEKVLPTYVKRILSKYPTVHLFSKALLEHLILRRVQQMKSNEEQLFPIAIFRSTHIGPAAVEPIPGWTSGLTGLSAWLALYGHSIPIIQPDQGQQLAAIVPVDYLSQVIVNSLPLLEQPKPDFVLPFADIANSVVEPKMPSNRNSVASSLADEINYFPYIYYVSTEATPTIAPPLTWYEAYTAIHDYWSRPNTMLQNQSLPTPVQYFSANKTISKARFLMRYYFKSQANAPPVPTHKPLSMNAYQSVGENVSMQEQKKWMELASAIRTCIQKQNKFQWHYDYGRFERLVSKLDITLDLDWYNYFLQSCYGVQYYSMNPNCHLRTCVFADQHVSCALYQKRKTLIDAPFPSVMYTEDEMKQRIQHMIEILITSLQDPSQYLKNEQDVKPIWIEYLNDTLEDWCDESRLHNYDATRQHWLSKVDENDEMLKISVINNQKVGDAIIQVAKRSGMSKDKVMEQALKSLGRIKERTQLSYAWFAASFLLKAFKNMFSGFYIDAFNLEKIRSQIKGKRVIYVPVSRTVLDPVLVWFLTIRYDLPIPALILDEALAILGPFSDILRLAGAVFIKRDPFARSNLSSAVTCAYLNHLLEERGAMTLVLEKVRSRTGVSQPAFDDGILDMISDNHDVVFVPINISYEEVPDISVLVGQDLFSAWKSEKKIQNRMSTPAKMTRPSDSRAQRVRSRSLGNGVQEDKAAGSPLSNHFGRLLVGISDAIMLTDFKEIETTQEKSKQLAARIQEQQKKAIVISPVTLVAAILLYSRTRGNSIDLETVKEYLEYLYKFIKSQNLVMDWQDSEDSEMIIYYSVRLLEKDANMVTIDERNNGTVFRINTRSESVLQLAYYANQLREIFVKDAIFAATYLSFRVNKIASSAFMERFQFLAKLFQHQLHTVWNIEEEYQKLVSEYIERQVVSKDESDNLHRLVFKNNYKEYEQLHLLASFIYPVIDSYWVTLCALSALNDVRALPLSLVPTLTQWVGMHLISGRRTIYSEVLSTEFSQTTVYSLVQLGLLVTQSAKLVLSPDAQMLMQALGLSTNDDLILQAPKDEQEENDDDQAKKESDDSDAIANLCKKIEQVRWMEEGSPVHIQVYERCQNQIKSLARTDQSNLFLKKQGASLSEREEESMIQLGYALLRSMESRAT